MTVQNFSMRAASVRAHVAMGTKVCRYNWHSAGSLSWPFPIPKYKYIFLIKYTEAILSNGTRTLLWFEINKMLIAVEKKIIASFIIIFGTLSFPILCVQCFDAVGWAAGRASGL